MTEVDFRADIVQKGTLNLLVLCETSTFRRVDGAWRYSKGAVEYEAQTAEFTEEEMARVREMAAKRKEEAGG